MKAFVNRVLTPFNLLSLILLALSLLALSWVGRAAPSPRAPTYGQNTDQNQVRVKLYFSDPRVQGVQAEERVLGVDGTSASQVARAALAALVWGPKAGGALRALPAGAEVPQVWVRGEHVFVNLPASYTRLGYGTSGENMLVCTITKTLLDLRGAHDVTFLVAGENADSLMGHLDLREPFTAQDCP